MRITFSYHNMLCKTSLKGKRHVYNSNKEEEITTFSSLFAPLKDENKYLEHISDDEDYEDPALYELFKGTQIAKYFKKQKTSNNPEPSDRISDDGLFNDLEGAAIDDGWDGLSVGDDWTNGDDQSETVTEEVHGRYRQEQTTLFSAWKESMKKFVKGYLSWETPLPKLLQEKRKLRPISHATVPQHIECSKRSIYFIFFWHCKSLEFLILFSKLIFLL